MRLRAHLSGALDEPPHEWVVSRVCEEFGCLPSHAVRELEDGDADLVFTILEMRAYARTKEMVDRAERKADLPNTAAVRRVLEIELEAMKGAI